MKNDRIERIEIAIDFSLGKGGESGGALPYCKDSLHIALLADRKSGDLRVELKSDIEYLSYAVTLTVKNDELFDCLEQVALVNGWQNYLPQEIEDSAYKTCWLRFFYLDGSVDEFKAEYFIDTLPVGWVDFINEISKFFAARSIALPLKKLPLSRKIKGKEYIYCSCEFTDYGRSYYYKTTDESIEVGDCVLVESRSKGKTAKAYVVRVERFDEHDVPYPIDKTKNIVSKYIEVKAEGEARVGSDDCRLEDKTQKITVRFDDEKTADEGAVYAKYKPYDKREKEFYSIQMLLENPKRFTCLIANGKVDDDECYERCLSETEELDFKSKIPRKLNVERKGICEGCKHFKERKIFSPFEELLLTSLGGSAEPKDFNLNNLCKAIKVLDDFVWACEEYFFEDDRAYLVAQRLEEKLRDLISLEWEKINESGKMLCLLLNKEVEPSVCREYCSAVRRGCLKELMPNIDSEEEQKQAEFCLVCPYCHDF